MANRHFSWKITIFHGNITIFHGKITIFHGCFIGKIIIFHGFMGKSHVFHGKITIFHGNNHHFSWENHNFFMGKITIFHGKITTNHGKSPLFPSTACRPRTVGIHHRWLRGIQGSIQGIAGDDGPADLPENRGKTMGKPWENP